MFHFFELKTLSLTILLVGLLVMALPASAHAPSGAIFTTVFDGSEVNYNIYLSKDAVYLDGGPGPGAPQTAAGLDDGTYVFQVTDPSGKVLLSTDAAICRQFTVLNGIINGVVPTNGGPSCAHVTGADIDHGAKTVQLMPYLDTPNPGGVYKVWVTLLTDYACNTALNLVDCGSRHASKHGFIPAHCKTDNFKVRSGSVGEIDTRFYDNTGQILDGLQITWIDTNSASNRKSSYYSAALNVNHEAHVEAPEIGTHQIVIANQTGCAVDHVHVGNSEAPGPQTVKVSITTVTQDYTIFVDVQCK